MIAKFPYGKALVQFPAGDPAAPGCKPQRLSHRLHELPQFGDDALIRLLDGYRRQYIRVFTMGTDPTNSEEWALVEKGNASRRVSAAPMSTWRTAVSDANGACDGLRRTIRD